MENSFNNIDFNQEGSVDLKQEIIRYLRYWPWFVLTLIVALISAYLYLRYTPRIYQTYAKLKILDESEGLELPTSAFIFKRTNINLENEIEILTSYLITEKVVRKLNLNTSFYEEGTIQTSPMAKLPLTIEQHIAPDSIMHTMAYKVNINATGFTIINMQTEKSISFPSHSTAEKLHDLPFDLSLDSIIPLSDIIDRTYIIKFFTIENTTLGLKNRIKVEAIGEQSDLLQLNIKGESKELSESILDTLMGVFDSDGIYDRQQVSQRTINFIKDRFESLSSELDDIEVERQDFKQDNNLVDLTADAEIELQQRTQSDEEMFKIETEIELAKLLDDVLNTDADSNLLPANIGLENNGLNTLVEQYNQALLNRAKLVSSAGINNPSVQLANNTINNLALNIKKSLNAYINQLEVSKNQIATRNNRLVGRVSQIPEKEKLLRGIERQQKIKESLYLLLLQKREEAAINLAITEPSIKIVEKALSSTSPISPKGNIVYAGAILGGLLIPFGVFYLIFMLDTKIHSKEDILKLSSEIPVIAEIPDLKKKEKTIFNDPNDRSALAESFRILSANVDYILPLSAHNQGQVVYCTSTVKGEGKTYVSINLSLALSSINKKVLLIGADLRNPQIHTHIREDKHKPGLSNYLHDVDYDWKDALISGFEKHPNHHIILSGVIPPNPANLLTNGRFKKLIEEAKLIYDYIIIDTAPTILVTDTMLISQLADATIFIARANFTDKKLLEFSKELHKTKKLKNMAYVVNGVGASKSYGYSYNYGYNYGYGSKD